MRTVTIAIALVAAVGCGDDRSLGAAEDWGGDRGGADDWGELADCATVLQPFGPPGEQDLHSYQEKEVIPTEPGDILLVTFCDPYLYENGVEAEPLFDEECLTLEFRATGDTIDIPCHEVITVTSEGTTTEDGYGRIYVRRVEEEIR